MKFIFYFPEKGTNLNFISSNHFFKGINDFISCPYFIECFSNKMVDSTYAPFLIIQLFFSGFEFL